MHPLSQTACTKSLIQSFTCAEEANPGPRRGREDAFEKQIAVKWHIVTPAGSV